MSLGKRIKERREALGFTQKQLAELIGLAQQSLQGIESGRVENPRRLENIAKGLDCTPEWLKFGITDFESEESNVAFLPSFRNNLPLISWVQAGMWSEIEEIDQIEAEKFLCPLNCSERSFVLRVEGASMETKFMSGDHIFIDPEAQWESGSYVVARLDDSNQATFKQLIIEGDKQFLKAINPNWPEQFIPINGNCTIVGRVIYAGRSL